MRGRVADESAREGGRRRPTGNGRKAAGLPRVADRERASGAGGRSGITGRGSGPVRPDDSVGVCKSRWGDRASGEKKRGHWIYKQTSQLHGRSPFVQTSPWKFFYSLGILRS